MLGPNVVIGPGVKIGAGVRLQRCVVMSNAVVRDHAWVANSIIGWNSNVGRWVCLYLFWLSRVYCAATMISPGMAMG